MFKLRFSKSAAALCLCLLLAFAAVLTGFARTAYAADDGDSGSDTIDYSENTDEPVDVAAVDSDDEDKSAEGDPAEGSVTTTGTENADDPDATPAPEQESEEEEEEEEGVKFVLFEKMAKLEPREWLLFSAALAVVTGTIVYVVMRVKRSKERAQYGYVPPKKDRMSTTTLVFGALCIALSFALSYIKLFSMPTGGSITLASMLPLCVYSNRFGFKNGVIACVVYGFLQLLQSMYILSIAQMLLEYPIAFGMIAVGGLFRKLPVGVLVGCFLRFLCHFFASVIFWKEYLDPQYNMWLASLIYNGIYMGIDTAICLVIALIPQFNRALDTVMPNRKEKEKTVAFD